MTTKSNKATDSDDVSGYATGPDQVGRPAGPEHDKSFHVGDYYDADGKRIETDWDTDAQRNDPGIEPVEPAPTGKDGTMTAAEVKEHRKS